MLENKYFSLLYKKLLIIFIFSISTMYALSLASESEWEWDFGFDLSNTNTPCTASKCVEQGVKEVQQQEVKKEEVKPAEQKLVCPSNSTPDGSGNCLCNNGYTSVDGHVCIRIDRVSTEVNTSWGCDYIDIMLGRLGCSAGIFTPVFNSQTGQYTFNTIKNLTSNMSTPQVNYTVSGGSLGSGTSGGVYNFSNNNILGTTTRQTVPMVNYTVTSGSIGSGTSGGVYNFVNSSVTPNNSAQNGTVTNTNISNTNSTINNNQQYFSLSTKNAVSNTCQQVSCYATFSGPANVSALVYFELLDKNGQVISESGKIDVTGKTSINFANTFNGASASNYTCRAKAVLNGQVMNGDTKTVNVNSCQQVSYPVQEKVADVIYTRNDKK